LRSRLLDPSLVEIVADSFAFEADEIDSVDALVDFLSVENPAAEFLDANAQQLFVVLLDLASPRFVTWKILIFGFLVTGILEIVV
jgi:hypothetical protein